MARGLTQRREAPILVTALVASVAALLVCELPLHAGFRALGVAAIVLAAAREISARYRALTAALVLEDRRRVARDLHDGLAQELAFITSQSKSLERAFDAELVGYVGQAAQRALDESRTLIGALTRTAEEPLEDAIARAAEDVAGRAGASVELHLQPQIKLEPQTGEALVRIVREAVTNAVRHGGAANIRVELAKRDVLHLRVTDDGVGFSDTPGVGFGVTSMRQRAEALGGSFELRARADGGTSVEIQLP